VGKVRGSIVYSVVGRKISVVILKVTGEIFRGSNVYSVVGRNS
jgi:hypothetical protein